MRPVLGPVALGIVLTLSASIFAAAADGLTKELGSRAPAAAVLCLVGGLVAFLAILANASPVRYALSGGFRTSVPGLVLCRSALSVISVALYFQAFRTLAFAEVFLFIGLMPVMAAVLARPLLGESVAPLGWVALVIGTVGLGMLAPDGLAGLGYGHLAAFGASLAGTVSLVLMRRIALVERNPFAQVFYPHLALFIVNLPSSFALQGVLTPHDIALVVALSILVLVVRSMLVPAYALLRAHLATMLMNLQFVWMLGIGLAVFAEPIMVNVIAGGVLVILSGLALGLQEWQRPQAPTLAGTPGE